MLSLQGSHGNFDTAKCCLHYSMNSVIMNSVILKLKRGHYYPSWRQPSTPKESQTNERDTSLLVYVVHERKWSENDCGKYLFKKCHGRKRGGANHSKKDSLKPSSWIRIQRWPCRSILKQTSWNLELTIQCPLHDQRITQFLVKGVQEGCRQMITIIARKHLKLRRENVCN